MYCGGALTSHIATSTKIWEPWPRVNIFVSFPCRWPTQTLPRQPVSNTRVSLYSGFCFSNIKIPPHSINYYCWIIWQIIKHIFTLSIIFRIWLDSGRWNYLWNNNAYLLFYLAITMPPDTLATIRPGHQQAWYWSSKSEYSVLSIRRVNTFRPRQNGRHFPDDIFKCIFVNENTWISIKFSLQFVSEGGVNNS